MEEEKQMVEEKERSIRGMRIKIPIKKKYGEEDNKERKKNFFLTSWT
jgi:hypothetical protein